ncbi:MAG TPA: TraR/DksA family transcriptional regulator [Casimicrobiaceae bacterium]|nr:TraR/DksA family transcriptional regulator [Casimicrobiaceae bacterium]
MSLSRSHVTELAEQLDRRRESLLEEVRDELEHSENQQYIEIIGRVPPDVGDQSVGDALADLNLAIIDRHVEELRDIDAAKLRIKDGSFGICIDCGGDIGFERLRAYPTAKRCRPCQEHREKTYAHQGTPSL